MGILWSAALFVRTRPGRRGIKETTCVFATPIKIKIKNIGYAEHGRKVICAASATRTSSHCA